MTESSSALGKMKQSKESSAVLSIGEVQQEDLPTLADFLAQRVNEVPGMKSRLREMGRAAALCAGSAGDSCRIQHARPIRVWVTA